MSKRYILKGKTPIVCDDLLTWAHFFEEGNRRVAETVVGGTRISTVFLGLDHSFGNGPPLLFETMIFGPEDSDYQTRCSTWAEAERQHAEAVEIAKRASVGAGS